MRHLQYFQADDFTSVPAHDQQAPGQLFIGEPLGCAGEQILARAARRDPVAEALAHGVVVGGESHGHAVQAVFVLGVGVGPVMDVHEPAAVALPQYAVGRDGESLHGEQRDGVVAAVGLLPRLQGAALDLQTDDRADLAHNAIYSNVLSWGPWRDGAGRESLTA